MSVQPPAQLVHASLRSLQARVFVSRAFLESQLRLIKTERQTQSAFLRGFDAPIINLCKLLHE